MAELDDTVKYSVSAGVETTAYIGINIHPGIEWVNDALFDFSSEECGAGILATFNVAEAKAEGTVTDTYFDNEDMELSSNPTENETEIHLYALCVDGEVKVVFKLKIGITLLKILDDFGGDAIKSPPLNVEPPAVHLTYFYISILDENSIECFKLGFGKCPNRVFLFDAAVKDADTGEAIPGAKLTFTSEATGKSFTEEAPNKVWVKVGNYTVKVQADGYPDVEKSYEVPYESVKKPAKLELKKSVEKNEKTRSRRSSFHGTASLTMKNT